MNIPVSVIVPIYNARSLMYYTVDSLLVQTLQNIEIILVDDCSTDGSADLLEEHYASEKNVHVIRQEKNGGPGEARNRGIAEAKGEYVCFCDSDDQIRESFLQEMYEAAVTWNADVVHTSGLLLCIRDNKPDDMLELTDEEWCVLNLDNPGVKKPVLVTERQEELLNHWMKHGFHWTAFNKMYRRDFLLKNRLHFGKMRLAEDQQFCFCCLFTAERYLQLPAAGYCYRQSDSSLSRGAYNMEFLKRCLSAGFEISRSMETFGREHPWFREHPQRLNQAAAYILECLETAYTRKAWHNLGGKAVLEDDGIVRLFREYCGDLAPFVMKQCCDAFSHIMPVDTALDVLNSPAALRKLVKEGKLHTLKEMKETAGRK